MKALSFGHGGQHRRDGRSIAVVGPGFPPQIGGVQSVMQRHAIGLAERGFRVEVLAQWQHTDGPLPLADNPAPGVVVRWFASRTHSHRFPVAPSLAWYLSRHGHRFDIIHGHGFHGSAAVLAALCTKRPYVYSPHYHGGGHTRLASVVHVAYGPLAQRTFERADAVVCVSRWEAKRVVMDRGIDPTLVHVIPNGVDHEEICAAKPMSTSCPVILIAGRLEAYKQVDLTIRAMAHLQMPALLVVVGSGPERANLEALAEHLAVTGRVRFEGGLSTPEVRRWQRTASVVVSLSRHEAFGLVPLEGLAAGAHVIVSDIPAHRELAELVNGELVLVPATSSPEEVAQVLRKRLVAPMPPMAYGLPSWGDAVESCVALYEEVLHKDRAHEVMR